MSNKLNRQADLLFRKSMSKNIFPFLFLFLFCMLPFQSVRAQDTTGPVYVVQSGDSLSSIARQFNVSVKDLMAANNTVDPNLLGVGQQLVIPGLEGVTGVLQTEVLNFGDSFQGFVRRTKVPAPVLAKLNHIVSPNQLYVGASMIVPARDNQSELTARAALPSGTSLLELAVAQNSDPWTLVSINNLAGSWDGLPNDALYIPGTGTGQESAGLPAAFLSVEIPYLPFRQGGTTEILVKTIQGVKLSGSLNDRQLNFFQKDDGTQVALQGIYTLLNQGPYPLSLIATLPDGTKQTVEQMILVESGNYPTDPVLSVSPDTIDPTTNDAETKQIGQLTAPATPARAWVAKFTNPSPNFPDCHPSYFGNRRNYVGSGTNETYHSFHAGLDFCGQVGTPIAVAADGTVVFTGLLTVHGNTTIVDHGWGIYTLYAHQSEINVTVGQQVKAGSLIGLVGQTGRVSGPHLHWEVWVNGVQVDPLDWLANTYP